MSRRYQFSLLAVLIALVSTGCRTDLTDITPEVQSTGIFGLQLRTSQELILLKDRPAHMLYLTIPDLPPSEQDNWGKYVGVLEAGTELQINQAVRVTEPVWVLPPLPGYWTWNCILARVETGPYTGQEVAIAGDGIGYGAAVVLGSSPLRPVDQASMISAFYNRPYYVRLPVPDKYDFYDSNSNQFATVTLVLSGQHFFGKEDGMWFGSLARSYVRPKSDQILASDKLNVHDLHRLACGIGARVPIPSRFFPVQISLYPDDPSNQITLFMPLSERNERVRGKWIHETDAGEVESGTFAGPIR